MSAESCRSPCSCSPPGTTDGVYFPGEQTLELGSFLAKGILMVVPKLSCAAQASGRMEMKSQCPLSPFSCYPAALWGQVVPPQGPSMQGWLCHSPGLHILLPCCCHGAAEEQLGRTLADAKGFFCSHTGMKMLLWAHANLYTFISVQNSMLL